MNKTFIGFIALVWLVPLRSDATLGGLVDSVDADRVATKAQKAEPKNLSNYTVHTLPLDLVTVREYVSPAGTVFGLGWNGQRHPGTAELSRLLGSTYWDKYQALRRSRKKRGFRSTLSTKEDRLVVAMEGHARSFQGHVYDPSLIPPGVNPDEIK